MTDRLTFSAAANMAYDLTLLEDNPKSDLRFRHYGWAEPTATFGYTQSLSIVERSTRDWGIPLMRRPTGGGIVDHRADWTYALVIPAKHHTARQRPLDIYEALHETLRESLATCALASDLARTAPCTPALSCFSQPVRYDLIAPSGQKLAGAAMKRTRDGILIQGSITHPDGKLIPRRFLGEFLERARNWLQADLTDFTTQKATASSGAYEELKTKFRSEKWEQRRP